nr:MAG TPA: hypothetical protein [Caudoviricetes sp.]
MLNHQNHHISAFLSCIYSFPLEPYNLNTMRL